MADIDYLSMDDEEFIKTAPATSQAELEAGEYESTSEQDDSYEAEEEAQETTDDVADPISDEAEEGEESPEETDDGSEEESPEESEDPAEEEEAEPDTDETDEDESGSEPSLDDLQRILAPFRANGTDIQVKTVDEALTLMKMGANYTKKMQALTPNLKLMKSLDKNGLLTEDKLNYLIDLSNKDPKAIAKLVNEAGIDPMDITNEVEYKPTNHQVSDAAMQLEQVLESIESTPTYERCVDVVGNQWDKNSQDLLTREPKLIAQINEQMSNGVFDKIMQEVSRVRVFGGLSGMPDFEAYKQVGAQMYQRGEFNAQAPAPTKQKPVATTNLTVKDTARSLKRKAATIPKPTRKAASKQDKLNPLALSDDEFLKIHNIKL